MYRRISRWLVAALTTFGCLIAFIPGVASASLATAVYGTGGLGVRLHTAPSALTFAILADGTPIEVFCQSYGPAVRDPATGFTSAIWDYVSAGGIYRGIEGYMSDLYVRDTFAGSLTPGIPLCGRTSPHVS